MEKDERIDSETGKLCKRRTKLGNDLANFCDSKTKNIYKSKIFIFDMHNAINNNSRELYDILNEYYDKSE